ncbi:unnamed protein product [Musa hybrid cultivar]
MKKLVQSLHRFCKEQEDCVCLKNQSRITPLQSSPLQCKLRFLVTYGSGIEATLSEGSDTGSTPHPIDLK